ncbi:MAG: YscO family type III secretion system apparatus protein [Desulfovibrio sp.]|nr:YscO family type III secretion system apparatus protein [Desulfovibrio sp.]
MAGAKYPLAAMLRVRGLHEDQAKRDARAAEQRLHEAQELRDGKAAELERYKAWRPQEEDRRYAAIIGKPMDAAKLGEFREDLARLAQGEVERMRQVHEADVVVQERQSETDAARQAVVLARRACMKLEEHRDIWTAAMRKEEERLADLEMEESRGPARAGDES